MLLSAKPFASGQALHLHSSPPSSSRAQPIRLAPPRAPRVGIIPVAASMSSSSENKASAQEMYKGYMDKFPGLPEMPLSELKAAIDNPGKKKLVVVDNRLPDEQKVAMIPTAVTKEHYEKHENDEFAGHKAVVYCTIGYRSGMLADSIHKKGGDAANLEGSILGWAHAGYPLVKGDPASGRATTVPVKKLHVFGEKWNVCPDGIEAVWFQKTPWLKLGADFVGSWVGPLVPGFLKSKK